MIDSFREILDFTSPDPAVSRSFRSVAELVDRIHDNLLSGLGGTTEAPSTTVARCLAEVVANCVAGANAQACCTTEVLSLIRNAGRQCSATSSPVDGLAVMMSSLTSTAIDVVTSDPLLAGEVEVIVMAREVTTISARLLRELFDGVRDGRSRQVPSKPLAVKLLSGRIDEISDPSVLAPAYAIAALRSPDAATMERVARTVRLDRDTQKLSVLAPNGAYVLAPVSDDRALRAFGQSLWDRIGGDLWIGLSWKPLAEIASGQQQASDIVRLAVASGRRPGLFGLEQVIVDFAVLNHPATASSLAKVVKGLADNSILHHTLKCFIAAEGNRGRAARQLVIHRSTLEYRLARIEEITGYQPTSTRGLLMLSSAMTAHALATTKSAELPHIGDRFGRSLGA
ncbi:CdaR family transcriptional regulator [Lentzea sp. HUAS12]|uniref:PucR family transcriptional regulator n=1 Tax=Lentzea sp. HUAS12 TaxID=2951806 RepID=UPI00209D95ED|nr:helix-turn-helix domain-containing protein [Lentzea sp. HUAS12]USX56260.1 helix-turn-helix domain-containing protein [Lentzea sp. HUAS12]